MKKTRYGKDGLVGKNLNFRLEPCLQLLYDSRDVVRLLSQSSARAEAGSR